MNTTPTWILVLGSAAVGALISSVISELGKSREQKSRREELLLTKAIELSNVRLNTLQEIAAATKGTGYVAIPDSAHMAEVYYGWLKQLMETGKLPEEARTKDAFNPTLKKKGE